MSFAYIKIAILSILLFITSYFLTDFIYIPIKTHSYFNITLLYSLKIIGLMLAEVCLFSLSAGIWGNWKQYLFIALPVIAGVSIVTVQINFFYGAVLSMILLGLLCLDIEKANKLKNTLIVFKPVYILSLSTRGLLFIFSVIGGLMVLLSSPSLPNINVGKSLATIIEPQVRKMVSSQLQELVQNQMPFLNLTESFPELQETGLIQQESLNLTQSSADSMGINVLIENQINSVVNPYKKFVPSIIAVLMFLLFQFYASIAKVIFSITIGPLFFIAKKLNFLHIEKVMVEKEELKF